VALPRSLSWLTRVLSTLPIPPWLGPGATASDRAHRLTLQTPTLHQARKQFWSTLWWSGTVRGHIFMPLLQNALHLTLQARDLQIRLPLSAQASRLHYRLTSTLMPSGSKKTILFDTQSWASGATRSESGIWHNRDLIRRNACADASPCTTTARQIR
jgi:hypothetical protein